MTMQGNLRDMTIADLIQHNCQDRKTARLTIRREGQEATIYLKDGGVVHATLDDLQGEDVVFRLLAWEDGAFDLDAGVQPPTVTIQQSWSRLLIEGARRLDEQNLENEQNQARQPEATTMGQLDDLLKQMSGEVNGFLAATVVGQDGLNVAELANGKINTEAVGAQTTLLLKLVDTTTVKLKAGQVLDNVVTTEKAYIMLRYLPDHHYFLGLATDRKTGSLGNMRLMSKMYADKINKAMPK